MAKLKKKNQITSTITYGWNMFLFARTFRAEIDALPEQVAATLDDLHQDYDEDDWRSQTANVQRIDDDLYTFDLRIYQHLGPLKETSVKATGRVLYSKGYEKTVIQGDLRLGWFNYLGGMVVALVMIVQVFTGEIASSITWEWLIIVPILISIATFIGWELRQDYRELNQDLSQALKDAAEQHQLAQPTAPHVYQETERSKQAART